MIGALDFATGKFYPTDHIRFLDRKLNFFKTRQAMGPADALHMRGEFSSLLEGIQAT